MDKKSFREEKGYTRVGGLFKSKAEKTKLEREQKRLNSFSGKGGEAIKRMTTKEGYVSQPLKQREMGEDKKKTKIPKKFWGEDEKKPYKEKLSADGSYIRYDKDGNITKKGKYKKDASGNFIK